MMHNFPVLSPADPEPNPGSIILIHGYTGTLMQRFHSDGLYHSVTGRTYTYEELFAANTATLPLLVFEPEED